MTLDLTLRQMLEAVAASGGNVGKMIGATEGGVHHAVIVVLGPAKCAEVLEAVEAVEDEEIARIEVRQR